MRKAIVIIVSYIKGFAHAVVVPYLLLWAFDDYGWTAVAISLAYIGLVGLYYKRSDRHDLSGGAFFGTLKALGLFLLTMGAIIGVVIAAS